MSKAYNSKSFNHLASYPVVQTFVSFALSFRVVEVLSVYVFAITKYTTLVLLYNIPALKIYLEYFDSTIEVKILSRVDFVISIVEPYYTKAVCYVASYRLKIDSVVSENKKHSQEALSSIKKSAETVVSGYLKPVNDYASSSVDKVLPKSKKKALEAKTVAENEISKSIEIVSDTIERSKDMITTRSTVISNAVISTYNKEFEAAPEKNYYVKVASASVHTGVTLLKNVNHDIIQPLKTQTRTYADENETRRGKKVENVAANGNAPVVSALA